jgi:hypothetical protein
MVQKQMATKVELEMLAIYGIPTSLLVKHKENRVIEVEANWLQYWTSHDSCVDLYG